MNQSLFQAFYSWAHRNPFLDVIFILLAKYLIYVLIAGFFYLLFSEKNVLRRYYFLFLTFFAVLISWGIVSPAIHYYYPNPRPFMALSEVSTLIAPISDSSFPSNHMMFIVPLVLSAFYLDRNRGKWFIAGAVIIGIGRIIAGVHWPFDILGGLLLGTACFYLARYLISFTGLKDKPIS